MNKSQVRGAWETKASAYSEEQVLIGAIKESIVLFKKKSNQKQITREIEFGETRLKY